MAFRHQLVRSDPHFTVGALRQSQVVYRPALSMLPAGLHFFLAARRLVVSRNAYSVAEVVRGAGSALEIVHAQVCLLDATFDDARLLHVTPSSATAWGRRDGASGIWKLTERATRLVVPFPMADGDSRSGRTTDAVLRTPIGNIAVHADRNGFVHYADGDRALSVPAGTQVDFSDTRRTTTLIPVSGQGASTRWMLPPDTNAAGDPDAPYRDECGGFVPLLPFEAERVRLIPYFDQMACLVSGPQGDILWRRDGDGRPFVPFRTLGMVEDAWVSSGRTRIATLVRLPNGMRQLRVGDEPVFEGRAFMRSDGFRWSNSGAEFVAHLTLTDDAGHQGEEVLVTRTRRIFIPPNETVYEPRVDDEGRVAYVLVDAHNTGHEVRRRLVAEGNATAGLLYVWNVSQTGDTAVANALIDDAIHRIEISYGR